MKSKIQKRTEAVVRALHKYRGELFPQTVALGVRNTLAKLPVGTIQHLEVVAASEYFCNLQKKADGRDA